MPLDYADRSDFDNATRGFIARLEPGQIKDADGTTVYDADIYAEVTADECPDTANPSLWRQSQLTAIQGLFEVTEGIYQLRGIDLSNMTVVEGDTGVIIIDPATNFTAGAGMIAEILQDEGGLGGARSSAAERIARVAREAATDDAAIEAVRKELEALLA